MDSSEALEFVNRGAELAFLRRCLERSEAAALVLIRGPAGFGKSRLTQQFSAKNADLGRAFCVVDPSIRGRTGSTGLHAGFFMQRCAEALDRAAGAHGAWPSLGQFLKTKPWKSARTKSAIDIVSELPSFEHAYKIVFDYAARAFSFGRFAPKQLLISDQADAVAICTAYAEWILEQHRVVLIVREAHHIDLESLRTLLQLNQRGASPDLIIEYTTDNGQFEREHQKLLLRAAAGRGAVHVLDLVRLEQHHLEYLIKRNVRDDFQLTSDYYLSWNGNLGTIEELKFDTGLGRTLSDGADIGRVLGDLGAALSAHISELAPQERMILAIVLSHVEAIDRTAVLAVLAAIDPRTSQTGAAKALDALQTTHAFLSRSDGALRIQNETIALALQDAIQMKAPVALAEKHLRDHYGRILDSGEFQGSGLAGAVRQYFRLCARTKDALGLAKATERLSDEIRGAQDQAIYVDIVASAIEADPELYAADHDALIDWAAALAYDTCDWPRAAALLSLKRRQDPFTALLRACALQEIGGHDEALQLAASVGGDANATDEEILASELLDALIVGCRGAHEDAKAKLLRLIEDPRFQPSPLLGYAYRFFEVVDGFIEALPRLETSIACFREHGFKKSMAYSQLPAAMFLARSGDIGGARALISEAQTILAGEVRDQHMILNNGAAVELLADQPDFERCRDQLAFALRLARDDFTELTILTNLGLAYHGAGEVDAAADCAHKCMAILEAHDFADTDIYWPVCFNASLLFTAAGDDERSRQALAFPSERGKPRADNQDYWAYRFRESDSVGDRYRFLASRPRHPVYLSHWLIDLEGLSLLKRAQPQ